MRKIALLLPLILAVVIGAWIPIGPEAVRPPPVLPPTPGAEEITAALTIERCRHYEPIVRQWLGWKSNNFHVLTEEHIPLVLSIMAHESECNPYSISQDGHHTIGLMQLVQKPWFEDCIEGVSCNIFWGMWTLDRLIEKHGYDIGIAAYNCSIDGIRKGQCGPRGGMNYSRDIQEFWMPRFE